MRNLLYIIDYFKNIDPCGEESTCLVRPACHMRQETPWERDAKCPDYKKYTKRRYKFNLIKTNTVDWFWIIIMISIFLFILFIFGLGIWTLIEFIKDIF